VHVASVFVYPVKGCRAVQLTEGAVEPWGLVGDRRWMVVDAEGKGLTQRDQPALARVRTALTDHGVELVADGLERLAVKTPLATRETLVPVRVWRTDFHAVEAADDAHAWWSELLGTHARLVWLDDPYRRPRHETYGSAAAMAESFPLHATSQASLDGLNDWLVEAGDEPVPMDRFRPNLVIGGVPAWAEDGWTTLRLPDVELRVTKPCPRCVVTTTDQRTGERRGPQPLRTLARRRRIGTEAVFGVNLVPDRSGTIRSGAQIR
jgi:uncharacterized protein YcbX